MGDDTSIVQSASFLRQRHKTSFNRLRFNKIFNETLAWHTFECEIKYHIKLPIFIARQWIRHRTANVNEYSARYSILDKKFYLPSPENLAAQSTSNRQGKEKFWKEIKHKKF